MKKLQLFLIPLLFSITTQSQSFYIRAGKNFTKFNFHNEEVVPINLHSDTGNSYEVGCAFPIESEYFLHYELGLQLDEFNAYVEAPISGVTYNMQYVGINNALLVSIVNAERNQNRFTLDFKGGINIIKYIIGKEAILGKIYDLHSFPEFKNMFLVGMIGLQSKFLITNDVDLSLGYDRYISFFNTGNTQGQSLSFTSNQFKVGIHFQLN